MGAITKEKFLAYLKIQRSGKYNMLMDSVRAAKDAGLSHEDFMDILWNYTALYIKFMEY